MLALPVLLVRITLHLLRHPDQVLDRTLLVYERLVHDRRPPLRCADRAIWALLSRFVPGWREILRIAQPATVIAWQRAGFRLFWRAKSRKHGRPAVDPGLVQIIRRLAADNPLWGAPRIHGELAKIGYVVSQATVAKYMPKRRPRPSSGTWAAFLRNHAAAIVATDLFVVTTIRFQILYVMIFVDLERRRILFANVTQHPTADWRAQQLRNAFPWDTAPRHLIRDRDGGYGEAFRRTVRGFGIDECITGIRAPLQNAFCERVIGTLRRECFDHVIVCSEDHARRVLGDYVHYYNRDRTHLSLAKDAPDGRAVEPAGVGSLRSRSILGGLHHRYYRQAA